jgi:hypothetical protein
MCRALGLQSEQLEAAAAGRADGGCGGKGAVFRIRGRRFLQPFHGHFDAYGKVIGNTLTGLCRGA